MTAHAMAVIRAFVYGFALEEAALPAEGGEELAALADGLMAELGDYPGLARFTAEHVMQPRYDSGDEFERGLDLVLDGLEAKLEG